MWSDGYGVLPMDKTWVSAMARPLFMRTEPSCLPVIVVTFYCTGNPSNVLLVSRVDLHAYEFCIKLIPI